jgi:hypothetical protein
MSGWPGGRTDGRGGRANERVGGRSDAQEGGRAGGRADDRTSWRTDRRGREDMAGERMSGREDGEGQYS